MQKIKFGLIGYGKFGQCHARSIKNVDSAELITISARSEKTCQKAEEEFKVDTYTDYRELLKRKDIDVVSIVLPNNLHHGVALDSLEAGKHVLLEKPMALTVNECQEIDKKAKEKNLIVYIGFEARLSSLWCRIKTMIDEGKIGEPLAASVELWRGPYYKGSGGWRLSAGEVGSWVLEEPIHFFDLVRWYFKSIGEPETVYGRANSKIGEANLTDNFLAVIGFPKNRYATILFTLAAYEHHQIVKVIGDKGTLWANWSGAEARVTKPKFSLEYFEGKEKNMIELDKTPGELFELEEEIRRFTHNILNNEPPYVGAKDGIESVRLCLAAEESIRTGHVIEIKR